MEWRRPRRRGAGVELDGANFSTSNDTPLLPKLSFFSRTTETSLDGLILISFCFTAISLRERSWIGLKDLLSVTSAFCGPMSLGCTQTCFWSEFSTRMLAFLSSRLWISLRVPRSLRSSSNCFFKDIISWSIFSNFSFFAEFIRLIWTFSFLSSIALLWKTCPMSELHRGTSIFNLSMAWKFRLIPTPLDFLMQYYGGPPLPEVFNEKENLWEYNKGNTTKSIFMIALLTKNYGKSTINGFLERIIYSFTTFMSVRKLLLII